VQCSMSSEIKRLHWGCGGWAAPGWINADARKLPGVQLVGDIHSGLPLESDSVDYAASIHALQEIAFPKLVPVLGELRRVLKPSGILRLCLPDLQKGMAAYQRGDRDYFAVPDEDARTLSGKFIVQMLWYSYSRILFTGDFIEELLLKAGFARVDHCGYRQTHSRWNDIVSFDNRENESLFVEATK
jgi:predicted SAM-dependent methyltransferase